MPTVAEILKDHVTLDLECFDRLYLNGYVRVMALMAALTLFLHLPNGLRHRDLRPQVADLMGLQPEDYSAGKMTYDLRRLRRKGLIFRQPGTTQYVITPYGRRASLFLTRVHTRLFRPAFGVMQDELGVHVPAPLR